MHAIAQPHVHRWRTAPAPAVVLNHVRVHAVLQTEHVHTAGQHGHIQIVVMGIIQVVAVHLRVRHVQVVLRGHAAAPVNVPAEQSALHAMRGITCPMANAFSAKPVITARGITVEDNVQVQHILVQVPPVVHHAPIHRHMHHVRWGLVIGLVMIYMIRWVVPVIWPVAVVMHLFLTLTATQHLPHCAITTPQMVITAKETVIVKFINPPGVQKIIIRH